VSIPSSAPSRLSSVERVLTAVRGRALERLAPPPHAGPVRRLLRCSVCGRTETRTADEVRRLARGRWPECCGLVLSLAADAPPAPAPGKERRIGARRAALAGVRAEVHRGSLGLGPDLGLTLLDVSGDGIRVRLRSPLRPGEGVEVTLWPPGETSNVRSRGRVIWCRPAPDWGFTAGVRLRRHLTADEIAGLAR
jgi:hypothetical protein